MDDQRDTRNAGNARNPPPDARGALGARDAHGAQGPPLLTADQAAERLRVKRRTLQSYGERYGLWPVLHADGRDQTPFYDPADVQRVADLRAERYERARRAQREKREGRATTAVAPPADLAPLVRAVEGLAATVARQNEALARQREELAALRAEVRELREVRARLPTMAEPPPTPPAAPGDAAGAHRVRDTPRRPAGLWERLRRALGGA